MSDLTYYILGNIINNFKYMLIAGLLLLSTCAYACDTPCIAWVECMPVQYGWVYINR